MKRILICGALAALLLLTGVLLASADVELAANVIGSGGGSSESGAAFALEGTIGQPLVGWQQSAPYALCAGFWCRLGSQMNYPVYLPLVIKNN